MQFLTLFAKKYPNKGPCFYLALEWMHCWYKNAKVLHILAIFSKNLTKDNVHLCASHPLLLCECLKLALCNKQWVVHFLFFSQSDTA